MRDPGAQSKKEEKETEGRVRGEGRRKEVQRPWGRQKEVVGERDGGLWAQPHTHLVLQTVPHGAAGLRAGREKGWERPVGGCGSKISARG